MKDEKSGHRPGVVAEPPPIHQGEIDLTGYNDYSIGEMERKLQEQEELDKTKPNQRSDYAEQEHQAKMERTRAIIRAYRDSKKK